MPLEEEGIGDGAAVYLGRGIRLPSLAAAVLRRGRRGGGGQGGASTPPAEDGDVEVRGLRGRWPVGRSRGMAVERLRRLAAAARPPPSPRGKKKPGKGIGPAKEL